MLGLSAWLKLWPEVDGMWHFIDKLPGAVLVQQISLLRSDRLL